MLKRILKWVGIVLGALIAVLVIAFAVLYFVGGRAFVKVYKQPTDTVVIPAGDDAIRKGEHVAITRGCQSCHGADMAGGRIFIDSPALFTLAAANLTQGKGGVGAKMADADWVNAIRYGVDRKGHALLIMPSEVYYTLSDEDLGNLIAYLKALSPVDKEIPQRAIGPMGRVLLATGQFPTAAQLVEAQPPRPAAVPAGPTAEYGKYLANSVCVLCHGANLAGEYFPPGQPDARLTPNLTPAGELVTWSKDDFFKAMRTGVKPGGKTIDPDEMPWKQLGQMSDDELAAIYAYLQSLPRTAAPAK